MNDKVLRLLIGDPAIFPDYFGNVGLEATWPEKKIYIRVAKQFRGKPYSHVAKWYKEMIKKVSPHIVILEKNHDYKKVAPAFQGMNIRYVTTSAPMKHETRIKGNSVDKNWCAKEIITLKKEHTIQHPSKISKDMQELIDQENEMASIFNGTSYSIKRKRGRHDDLFMAKLIGINFILLWWEEMDNNR